MAKQEELCGCGRGLRYSHMVDDKEVMSCNKYDTCLTYDEQAERIKELSHENIRYKHGLRRISETSGMDYEYKAWAKEALDG